MRIWHRIIGGLAAAWLTAGLVNAAGATPLRLRYDVWVGFGPLFVAQEKGFFAKEGVAAQLIRIDDSTAAVAALYAGQVDAMATATPNVLVFSEPHEEPLACVLALTDSRGADGILATNDIRSIADLAGKSVAFIDRSISQFYLNVLLREVGLSEHDIEAVDLPPDKAAEAFMLREVDAAVTWEPFLSEGRKVAHGHVLTDTSERPGLLGDCLATKASTFDRRKEEFAALARAWDAAVRYGRTHPDEANAIMARNMREDPAAFAEMLQDEALYDEKMSRNYFGTPEHPGQIYQTMQYAIDIWTEQGLLDFKLSPSDLIIDGIWDE